MRCGKYCLPYHPHCPVNSAVSFNCVIRSNWCSPTAPKGPVLRILYPCHLRTLASLKGIGLCQLVGFRGFNYPKTVEIAKTYLGFTRKLDFQRKSRFKNNKIKILTTPYHSFYPPIKRRVSVLPKKPHAKPALYEPFNLRSVQTSPAINSGLDLNKHLVLS
jgi:hypothetical protein